MDRTELLKQYDRFIDQLRTEVKDLYWLFNFFFLIESAMIGALFSGKIGPNYLLITKITGLFLAIYWFVIIRKQRLWRNEWVRRIQGLESELGYSNDMQMWRSKSQIRIWHDYIIGRKGMWRFLFLLPVCFCVLWIILAVWY